MQTPYRAAQMLGKSARRPLVSAVAAAAVVLVTAIVVGRRGHE
jgi:hypothetical protein